MEEPKGTAGGNNPRSQSIRKSIMKRVSVLYVVFAVLSVGVFVMIVATQFGPNGTPLRNRSDLKCYRMTPIPASRGNIYSQDGRILATDSPSYNISLDFTVLEMTAAEFDKTARALSDSLARTIPGYSRDFFYRRLKDIYSKAQSGGRGSRNQKLFNGKVNQLQLDKMRTFPIFKEGRLGGGFIYSHDPERYRPYGTLAARTLGRPAREDVENDKGFGVEDAFDYALAARPGQNMCVRLYRDVWVPVVHKDNITAHNGRDVYTTINVNMQDIAESELRNQILKHNALAGTAVIMDVESGEIRAISNLTRYGDKVADDVNHAVRLRCEPGSTFKLVSLMALLEDAGYDINMPVDCTVSGKWYYQPDTKSRAYLVEDSHPVGKTTLMGVMEHSSNIGFVKTITEAYGSKPEKFVDFVRGLGIDRPINMQLSGAYAPTIKDPRKKETLWDKISLMKMAYGYAIELTPIHTLMLYNAVANKGVMVEPRLVTSVKEGARTVENFGREVLNRKICSDKTLAVLNQSLEGVVLRGTGSALNKGVYMAAGKTGTAQMVVPETGRYDDGKGGRYYLATFVGYFPADKPKYSCIVAIRTYNGPGARNTYYGASLSLPAFKAIADRVYALDQSWQSPVEKRTVGDTIQVKGGGMHEIYVASRELSLANDLRRRSDGWGVVRPDSARIEVIPVKADMGVMPSVTGMGLKDALFLLEQQGLKVSFTGKGRVVTQSIKEGTPLKGNETVTLTLRPVEEKPKTKTRR